MGKLRVIMIVLAAIAASIAAGMMALGFVGGKAPASKEVVEVNTVKTAEILVAAKEIKLGEKLVEGSVTWKTWPLENVDSTTMITRDAKPEALTEYKDARARSDIFSGEVVMDKKLVLSGDKGFLSSMLPKGMRAISVAISERSSAGGFILPNDRVDVILTKKATGDGGNLVSSETILTNVRVRAINQLIQQASEEGSYAVAEGKTATLELTARQAEVIAQVESMGELSLALRSIAENDGNPVDETPVLSEKYSGRGKPGGSDTLFVRYGRETYASNR